MTATPPNLRCFVIHLERAYERAPQVQKLVDTLPFETEIVSAIDGMAGSFDANLFYRRSLFKPEYPFSLRHAEVATFLSHRKAWQRIVDEDFDAGLILEDDVDFLKPDFDKALSLVTENFRQGDFIRFPMKLRETLADEISTDNDVKLFRPMHIGLGAQAQLVSREAAKRLLIKTQKFDRPIDTYLQLFWEHGVRVLSVWPNGINENSESLGGSLIGAKQPFRTKVKHEIQRPIYRMKLHSLTRKKASLGTNRSH